MLPKLYLILTLFLATSVGAFGQPTFIEDQGILRVDVESAEPLGQWVVRDQLAGFIGSGYLEFEGPNFFNNPGNSLLTYKIRITTPGTYLFRWHSRITEPGENTEFNDSWLRFPDADLVYGERNGSRVFPHGSGMTPTPEGSGSSNWLKVYQNRRDEWFWGAFTSDNDPHDIYAEFDNPGDYTVQISGRSTGHAIDRFVLVHSSASLSTAQDLTLPESERVTSSLPFTESTYLLLSPNPVNDFLNVASPADLPPATYKVIIHDFSGRPLTSFTQHLQAGSFSEFPVGDLPGGAYFLTLQADGKTYLGRFVK